jgi:DNA (cytosine-5)-methyltransferase 1
LIAELANEKRHPTMLVLENVIGLLNANAGSDFRAICTALRETGYRFGAVIVDASHFVPQSRPRVFIIAARREIPLPGSLHEQRAAPAWSNSVLMKARASLSEADSKEWVWWSLGAAPEKREVELIDLIDLSDDADWDTKAETKRLVSMMSSAQRARLTEAKAAGRPMIGSLYLRMRPDSEGVNVQRAEIAFGSTLGCLRTPKGGASSPRIIVVSGTQVRTRKVSRQEAAALMGFSDGFYLPEFYLHCFRMFGDGVVPAVVRFLAARLLEPLATHARPFVQSTLARRRSR